MHRRHLGAPAPAPAPAPSNRTTAMQQLTISADGALPSSDPYPIPSAFPSSTLWKPPPLPYRPPPSPSRQPRPGLNVSAPEFVPSFAVAPDPLPAFPPPLQPSVYSNVTNMLPDTPIDCFPSTPPLEQPAPSLEDAVHNFDRQFPALNTPHGPPSHPSPENTLPKALGWNALQQEEAAKQAAIRREELDQTQYELWRTALAGMDDLYDEQVQPSCDVGDVWVTTGQSVGHLYEQLRAEAAEQASIRNKYFDRAGVAFRKGDGAAAKRLGAQGREANARMKELHRQAADAIFEARNPSHVSDVIDMHGLHVSEAVERLPEALKKAPVGKVRILTGTGHHTKGTGRARLRPAVKKWLQENNFFFEEVVDANEFVGSFIVDVRK